MTHAQLVARAERWLRNTRGCGVVLTEFVSAGREIADAIGWCVTEGWSVLVECKASRSDFLRDQSKLTRREYFTGLGQERWYLTSPGLVRPDEIPPTWGLLEAHPNIIRVAAWCSASRDDRNPKPLVRGLDEAVCRVELSLLLSALRRHYCRACHAEINARNTPTRKLLHRRPEATP